MAPEPAIADSALATDAAGTVRVALGEVGDPFDDMLPIRTPADALELLRRRAVTLSSYRATPPQIPNHLVDLEIRLLPPLVETGEILGVLRQGQPHRLVDEVGNGALHLLSARPQASCTCGSQSITACMVTVMG